MTIFIFRGEVSFKIFSCIMFKAVLKEKLKGAQCLVSFAAIFRLVMQRSLTSLKNGCEGDYPVLWTCVIQCAQHMISMKKQKFCSCPRTKLRCHGPPGSARAQPWCYTFLLLLELNKNIIILSLFNPLSPSIHIQILQTDLNTFP